MRDEEAGGSGVKRSKCHFYAKDKLVRFGFFKSEKTCQKWVRDSFFIVFFFSETLLEPEPINTKDYCKFDGGENAECSQSQDISVC